MTPRGARSLILTILVVGVTAGCEKTSARKEAERATPLPGTPRARRQQLAREGIEIDTQPRKIHELTQHANGPGLVVCEPVIGPGAEALRPFGRGCARWLNFEAAGQGAAARSPLWWAVAFAHTRLEDRGLSPTVEHAVEAMGRLGATHVAVGEIRGTKSQATLTYRLYRWPERTAVGTPRDLTGSLNEIRKGLPAAAEQLSRDAGLTAPEISASVMESVPDLEYLGSLDRHGGTPYSPIDSPRLIGLAERSALGSLYRVMGCSKAIDEREIRDRCIQLVDRVSTNAAAWGAIGTVIRNCEVMGPQPHLHALLERALGATPRNTQLSLARAQMHMARKEWKEARGWTQEAVRCNIQDPSPFQILAECIRGENQDLSKRARARGGLTREENERIWTQNTQRLELFQHAATLNPADSETWEMVSSSAVLQRNRDLAETALRKSVECGKRNARPYMWGIEMYNRGHLNDPAARARFAELAASAPLKRPEDRIYISQLLHYRGLKGTDGRLHMRVLRTAHERKQVTDWVAGKKIPWGGNPPEKPDTEVLKVAGSRS